MPQKFYIDLDTAPARVLPHPNAPASAGPWRAKRGDNTAAHFYFVSNGLVTDVPTETTADISFQAKYQGTATTYSTAPLIKGTVTVGTDSNSRKYWEITPDWDNASAALTELLEPSNEAEPPQISLPAELAWEDVSDNQTSTERFDLIVLNDVVRGLTDTVLS